MAYVEMLGRDRQRFARRASAERKPARRRGAGRHRLPDRPHMTAKALGFDRPMANSLDAVSDRDFALEACRPRDLRHAPVAPRRGDRDLVDAAVRLRAPLRQAFSTGSSIMPQKRNPDAAELVRAKTGRIIGALVGC
jgi:argininosuccinate lyase